VNVHAECNYSVGLNISLLSNLQFALKNLVLKSK